MSTEEPKQSMEFSKKNYTDSVFKLKEIPPGNGRQHEFRQISILCLILIQEDKIASPDPQRY